MEIFFITTVHCAYEIAVFFFFFLAFLCFIFFFDKIDAMLLLILTEFP
jgi:hypothetical protein